MQYYESVICINMKPLILGRITIHKLTKLNRRLKDIGAIIDFQRRQILFN